MNNAVLIGRLTKDPDLRATNTGKSVCTFTLAVDRRAKGEADFIPCVAWEKTAEIVKKYTGKGKQIAVSGRLQSRSYEARNEKRWIVELIVDEVKLLSLREDQPFTEPMQPAEAEDIPF